MLTGDSFYFGVCYYGGVMNEKLNTKEKIILMLVGVIFVLLCLGSQPNDLEFSGIVQIQR